MSENNQLRIEASSLKQELASLFGEPVLTQALNCKVEDLEFSPKQIAQATKQIRHFSGQPEAQIEVARSLPGDVQIALCKWLIDDEMKEKVLMAKGVTLQ